MLADERRLYKLLHNWERPEYWEKSWRLEETCYHSNSSERTSANADVKNSYCYILTFWPGPKCHSRWCTGRKWHIPMAVRRGNRVGGNWLMKWDELKYSHGTLIDWCTGRQWPVNCMKVISAWWRSNMRFQRSSGCWTII